MARHRKNTILHMAGLIALALILFCTLSGASLAVEQHDQSGPPYRVDVYLFYGEGCPHCAAERPFLHYLETRYPTLVVHEFEVWHNQSNRILFERLAQAYGIQPRGVPTTFIGDYAPIIGYASNQTTGIVIEQRIKECVEKGCPDPLSRLEKDGTPEEENEQNNTVAGELEQQLRETGLSSSWILGLASRLSSTEHKATARELAIFSLILGFIDGFNPCAFFVLFALLGIMLTASEGSRKRALIVGLVFVFFSGFMYFLFMAAWLNIFLVLGSKDWIEIIAGVIAIVLATINIKDFFAFKKGISLTIPEDKMPSLFRRMRELTRSESLFYMAIATAVIAASVNMYELLCTAGLPMLFTKILTLHKVSVVEYYIYLVVYNIAYVTPLLAIVLGVVFFVSTMHMSERLGRLLKLTSGLMMLYLGVVLVAKPQLLTNVLAAIFGVLGSIAAGLVIGFLWFRLVEDRRQEMAGGESAELQPSEKKEKTEKKQKKSRKTNKRTGNKKKKGEKK